MKLMGTNYDRIPQGRFCALDDPKDQRRATVRWIIELGTQLAEEHPEIASFYRDTENVHTYLDIAHQYIPTIAEQYPAAASKAIGHAMRTLIPEEEQRELTALKRSQTLEDTIGDRNSEEWRQACSEASRRRHELHEVDTDAMILARGRTPWTEEEKLYALELSMNTSYQHQTGQHKGRPHYALIASALNITYHNGDEIRYINSVASFIKDMRRKEKQKNG